MKQVWITKAGPPEVLQVQEAADPVPEATEVRIAVEAAGINFADIMARLGIYPDAPNIPCVVGYEVAGKIEAIGEEVAGFSVGADVVALTRFNGYSDLVCVPENQCFLRPPGMSAQEGAAVPVNYLTAYQLMIAMGSLKAGETVLVHSAGGGVGVAAIQLAQYLGAQVIGTASARKHEALRAMGVDQLIDYRTEDFESRVLEMTQGRGVELILDAVGGKSFKKGMRILSPTGRLGMFGMSSAATGKTRSWLSLFKAIVNMPLLEFNPGALINDNKGVFGVNMGHMWSEVDRLSVWADELLALYSRGVIKPHVDCVFRFDQAAEAHHYIQDRKNFGKVLLVP